jgi:hypothetical protein
VFASLVLVPSLAAAQTQPSPTLKGNTVTLRACVQQGTHGSVAALRQVRVVAPAGAIASPRVMYWFAKNLDGFRTYTGNEVEIVGTVSDVLTGPLELKATDGVFAEVQPPAGEPTPVGTTGTDLPTTVVKADVTKLRMLGHCR